MSKQTSAGIHQSIVNTLTTWVPRDILPSLLVKLQALTDAIRDEEAHDTGEVETNP